MVNLGQFNRVHQAQRSYDVHIELYPGEADVQQFLEYARSQPVERCADLLVAAIRSGMSSSAVKQAAEQQESRRIRFMIDALVAAL